MSIVLDFHSRQYTTEVLRSPEAESIAEIVLGLTRESSDPEDRIVEGFSVRLWRGMYSSRRSLARTTRLITNAKGESVSIPREHKVRGETRYLYDVIVGWVGDYLLVGVPFHALAEDFFVEVDAAVSGMGAVYEKLDITRLVMELGEEGKLSLTEPRPPSPEGPAASGTAAGLTQIDLRVTRCQLAYSDPETRTRPLRYVGMSGDSLGDSEVYRDLIRPVLRSSLPDSGELGVTVTPILLGFALSVSEVRKVSALTDRHGNFKIWVSPSLRAVVKLFRLLAAFELITGVVSTTPSPPILQSKTIRGGNA